MQSAEVLKVYEVGQRGKPVANVGPGDLAQPYAVSVWKRVLARVLAIGVAIVEVARESRALEVELLGRPHYRRVGDS